MCANFNGRNNKEVGASKVRDAVDAFLVDELLSYGKKGKIITTEDDNGITNNVGTVASGTPPEDTDSDGMPDEWERLHGLNPDNADDCSDRDLSGEGYTNIEMYVNESAGDPVVFKGEKMSAGEAWSFPKRCRRPFHVNDIRCVEFYNLSGRLVDKEKKKNRFIPSGLLIVIEKNESGRIVKRYIESNIMHDL